MTVSTLSMSMGSILQIPAADLDPGVIPIHVWALSISLLLAIYGILSITDGLDRLKAKEVDQGISHVGRGQVTATIGILGLLGTVLRVLPISQGWQIATGIAVAITIVAFLRITKVVADRLARNVYS